MTEAKKSRSMLDALGHRALVSFGSVGATGLLFVLLPAINKIAGGERADTTIIPIDTTEIPPPDVIEEEEVEQDEPEEEEEPPELEESAEPLDLAQLEMAMNASFGGPGIGGDFAIDLSKVAGGGLGDQLGAGAGFDRKRRILSEQPPSLSNTEKKATPGKVVVIFLVDGSGRVQSPKIEKSSNPVLNAPTLRAVQNWRFERLTTPDGEPLTTHHRRTLNYPKL